MSFYMCELQPAEELASFVEAVSFSVFFSVCFLTALGLALKYRLKPFWIAPPVQLLLLMNAGLQVVVEPGEISEEQARFTEVLLILNALIVPMYMWQLFALTYMLQKNRGVNFCFCIHLEERGSDKQRMNLLLLRASVYLYIFFVFLVVLVSHGIVVSEVTIEDIISQNLTICTRGAFAQFIFPEEDDEVEVRGNNGLESFADVILPLSLFAFAGYFGYLLWRYGTFYAFRPSPTYLNLWMALLVYALILFFSLFFKDEIGIVNLSFLILQIACFLICRLVVNENKAFERLKRFLDRNKGNSASTISGKDRNEEGSDKSSTVDGHDPYQGSSDESRKRMRELILHTRSVPANFDMFSGEKDDDRLSFENGHGSSLLEMETLSISPSSPRQQHCRQTRVGTSENHERKDSEATILAEEDDDEEDPKTMSGKVSSVAII